MIRFVLFVLVLTLVACSDPAPVAPHPAGKATCALCAFLGDDNYTIADGQGDHESPTDSDAIEAEADSTQAEADSTQADSALSTDLSLGSFLGDDRYTIAEEFFADANLERVVRRALRQPQGRLKPEDFAAVGELKGERYGVHNLAGLERFVTLRYLYLPTNKIVNLTPMAQLNTLLEVDLRENQIASVPPLTQLSNLLRLNLGSNQIVDVTPLAQLSNLRVLWLWSNQIADVTPLAQLSNLEYLFLDYNQIEDVKPLANLTNLRSLSLRNNQIEDLSPLVANTGLGTDDKVNLIDNPLSTQALNKQIPALQARGVRVTY